MTDDFFMKLCDVYGFAPSRALRELVDAAMGQAVVAERHACARLCDELASADDNGEQYRQAASWSAERIRARGQA